MKSTLIASLAAASLLLVANTGFAHHSQAAYDTKNEVTLTGTVTEFLLVNPHPLIRFTVKDSNGNVTEWLAEGATPSGLRKDGWTSKTVKPGDEITIAGHVARNGRKEMHIVKVWLNGKLMRNTEDLYNRPGGLQGDRDGGN